MVTCLQSALRAGQLGKQRDSTYLPSERAPLHIFQWPSVRQVSQGKIYVCRSEQGRPDGDQSGNRTGERVSEAFHRLV